MKVHRMTAICPDPVQRIWLNAKGLHKVRSKLIQRIFRARAVAADLRGICVELRWIDINHTKALALEQSA